MKKKQYITPAMDIAQCECGRMMATSTMKVSHDQTVSDLGDDFEMQSNSDKGWDLW